MLKVYVLATCDACRKAVKWLEARGAKFEVRAIRETPPPLPELQRMLAAQGGAVRKLCNTSGREYRELKLGEKLPAMADADVLALLAGNGNLVKRPFVIGPKFALVGFAPEVWAEIIPAPKR
jgi:arsenate reductase (glutaredoxin)